MTNINEVTLYVRLQKTFSFLEYHTDATYKATLEGNRRSIFSLFKTITIENESDTSYDKLILNFESNSPYLSIAPMELFDVRPHVKYPVREDPNITVDGKALYELNGIDVMKIDCRLIEPMTGDVLASVSKTIQILPVKQCTNDWDLAPMLLAKYCVTSFPDAYQVQANALKYLTIKDDYGEVRKASFAGYQYNEDPQSKHGRANIVSEVKAIYNALHDWGITYADPENYSGLFQNVRLPNKVLSLKHGTCLDLALLMCSIILQVGLHPILVLVQGHAFAGVFLDENGYFNRIIEKSPAKVFSRANLDKDILLFECTTLSFNNDSSFAMAVEKAKANLDNYGGTFYAVDVHQAQKGYLKAIPLPEENGEVDLSISPVRLSAGGEVIDVDPTSFNAIEGDEDPNRFITWQKKLLELSTKNRLVNFPRKTLRSVGLLNPLGAGLYDKLKNNLSGKVTIRMYTSLATDKGESVDYFDPSASEIAERLLLEKHPSLLASDDSKKLKKYIKESNSAKEETGSPTLYLALGSVICRSGAQIEAPFLLLPITVTKDRLADSFTMSYDFDDIHLNTTFFEFVKIKVPGADYSSVYGFDSDGNITDLKLTIERMAKADLVVDISQAYIANFSFGHYVMWKDITDRKEELLKNDVIRSFVENKSLIENKPEVPEPSEESIENYEIMERFAAPCPYDSTQLRAILECGAGNSFILDGPPGTGKSQTIVNMIVNAFYNRKTVLFVAQKQAALDVVRKRLRKLGLDRFVLELYSNKANKQAMLSRLNDSINMGPTSALEDFSKICEGISEKKEKIKKDLEHLHKAYINPESGIPVARSLYGALLGESLTGDSAMLLELEPQAMGSYTLQMDEDNKAALSNVIAILEGTTEAVGSPIRAFSFSGNFLGYRNEIHESFKNLKDKAKKLEKDIAVLRNKAGFAIDNDAFVFGSALEMMKKALSRNIVSAALSEPDLFEEESSLKVQELLKCLKKRNEIADRVNGKYDVSKLSGLNTEYAYSEFHKKGFLASLTSYKKTLRILEPYLLPSYKPAKGDIDSELESLSELQSLIKRSEELRQSGLDFFNEDILLKADYVAEYETKFQETSSLFKMAKEEMGGSFSERISFLQKLATTRPLDIREAIDDAIEDLLKYQKCFDDVSSRYGIDASKFALGEKFDGILALSDEMSSLNSERIVRAVMRSREEALPLTNSGMGFILDKLLSGELPLNQAEDAFENAVDRAFIDFYYKHDDFFNTFDKALYEKTVAEYQEQINDYDRCSVEEVTARITEKFPDVNVRFDGDSSFTTLRKLAATTGRGKTIRTILSTYQKYIRMYYPCFLMSPQSAAQYLDLSSKKFDIVIFDEASQIPTSQAVGPIARGEALIVAGDPEQMPPTSYFQSNSDGGESGFNVETSDAESLLDDCISVGLPRIRLSYHYRSQHQSLIEFSNENFYDSGLFTFPSYDSLTSHVHFRYVPLSSKKKTNEMTNEEKDAIISELVDALKKPENRKKSFGIIVFNIRQQEKIADALDAFFEKSENAELRRIAYGEGSDIYEKDPLFIKNLENVQGDERDIIFISIGFSKSSSGKANITGPLALDKGERRLNVAASRAKEEIHVISTIHAYDIEAEKAKNSGALFLKRFLDFAENASLTLADLNRDKQKSDVASLLSDDLRKQGLLADAHVGNSRFTIDVAIRDPNSKNYLLGILLDEKPLGNITCRDRFYVDEVMLSALGWQLLRVYCFDYFNDREKVIESIKAAFENAKSRSPRKIIEKFDKPLLTDSTTIIDYPLKDYEDFDYKTPEEYGIPYDYLVKEGYLYDPDLAELIKSILEKEEPILFEKLVADLRVHVFGKTRLGDKGRDYISFMLKRLNAPQTISGNNLFYWAEGNDEHLVTRARVHGKDIKAISKEEIAFVMGEIVKKGGINERNLVVRSTAKSFGFATPLSIEVVDYLNEVYDEIRLSLNRVVG